MSRPSCCSSCDTSQIVPSSAAMMCLRKMRIASSRVEAVREQTTQEEASVLDLPELALECILERLPPAGLFNMAGVCRSLRERCSGDFLWERHMRRKWGGLIGESARKEWKLYVSSRKELSNLEQGNQKCLLRALSGFCPVSWVRSKFVHQATQQKSYLPSDSIMSWYLALESGKFWFPAQVYNRENGHVGFMLSCYDAELCYDSKTDTFQARYPPHGRRAAAMESRVTWDRIRAPPVNTPPHDLHITNCLQDLRPGDSIEIQWRRNKGFPYGWWYGVVGHLESCDGNTSFCRCQSSDTVVLEFDQYAQGSRWRYATIDRWNHREEGNEADGFYGGIRKLWTEKEISIWKQLWPTDVLE
ncbi:hypothetical protein MLD38_004161 [Melastoma candidum]|uniref:Uncharacterized protein n=1 Tax=Melastoma candidum TaxID=119954 RepID=A0ACB9S8N9_9MYRT|nr:hypothetical protein MLD38_004161 [Melastoma candidum]